jgi:drug/metabolite transporter (DMT)-like permease
MTAAIPEPSLAAAAGQRGSSPLPYGALVLGALAMGISPIFVRIADVGPIASAFWRVGAALPVLWLWAAIEARSRREPIGTTFRVNIPILVAGLVFAGDLLFWHLSIVNTTVANATLLSTMAPVWVVLGSRIFIAERVGSNVVYGLALCVVGAAALIGTSVSLSPEHLVGDAYGLATSVFFGAYFLAVRSARRRSSPGRIVFLSALITASVMLVFALLLEDRILPQTTTGALALAGLALVSHSGGQGLVAYALGHLPAAFSSLVVFIEAPAAALFAFLFLGEQVSAFQAAGGALILAGIYIARPRPVRTRVPS